METNALADRIRHWRNNALRNAKNANDAAERAIENGATGNALMHIQAAYRFIAQADAYADVITIIGK